MEVINYKGNKSTFKFYDSISSMSNIQVPAVNAAEWADTIRHRSEDSSERWLGCRGGVSEVRRLVELEGWALGVAQGQELMEKLVIPKLPSVRRKKCWGPTGHTLNIQRMYSGSADKAWQRTYKDPTLNKTSRRGAINLIVDLTVGSCRNANAFFWKGAITCVLAKKLMQSGRNVRVIGAFSVSGFTDDYYYEGRKNLTMALTIKDYGRPVEYNSMFAVTALAGCARYYFFKSILSLSCKIREGIGRPARLNTDNLEPILDANSAIIIEDIWTREAALARAEKIIEDL